MKIQTKITVGTAIRWEQLTGRSFYELDYSDQEDLCRLLYCAFVVAMPERIPYSIFCELLEANKISRDIWRSLQQESDFIGQFIRSADNDATSESDNYQRIEDIVASLVINGALSIDYAMNEMLLCDLPAYVKAYEQKLHQQMESNRYWVFHLMRPHVDAKKFNDPKQVCIFPWEAKAEAERAEKLMREQKETLDKFLRGELFDINSFNWTKQS